MAITARTAYVGEPRESADKYGANQLLFVSWDHHLLFAAPFLLCLPSVMPFRELLEGPLAQLLSLDPDATRIDWASVRWLKGAEPFHPELDKSLADNGIGHKDQLRFATPGLNTVCGGD